MSYDTIVRDALDPPEPPNFGLRRQRVGAISAIAAAALLILILTAAMHWTAARRTPQEATSPTLGAFVPVSTPDSGAPSALPPRGE